MIATFVMKPDHTISGSDRTYKGIAVGRHGDTGFLGCAEGHLFGLAIGGVLGHWLPAAAILVLGVIAAAITAWTGSKTVSLIMVAISALTLLLNAYS